MPKIIVTQELAETIRGLRQEKKVTAKSLAEHIHKSQSYVSKFERGDIKTISKEELDSMLHFVMANGQSYSERVDEILKVATYRYSAAEMEAQVWFSNYSTVFCSIPIPNDLIDDINQKMNDHGISQEMLCRRINANEFLPKALVVQNHPHAKYPYNEWFSCPETNKDIVIIMRVRLEDIRKVLNKETPSISYVFLQAIAQYMFKIIEFGEETDIPDESSVKIYKHAEQYLHSYNYYPISEKYRRLQAAEQLSIPDQRNQEEIQKIMNHIYIASELNVQRTNERLAMVDRNIEWNGSFMGRLFSLPFADLGKTSYPFRKRLMDQIVSILDAAINSSEDEKQAEEYE